MTPKEFLKNKNITDSDFMDSGIFNLIEELITEYNKKEKLTRQLFVGKVCEIIGFDKSVEILKEVKETVDKI